MIDEEAERMYELRDELDADAQRAEAGLAAATASTAEDESGSVEVSIEDEVPVVTVNDGWYEHHSAAGLGPAILSVVVAIGVKRLEQSQEASREATPHSRPIPSIGFTPAGIAQTAIAQRGDQLDTMAMLGRLTAMIDTIASGIDETVSTIVQRGSASRSSASTSGNVTAEVRGTALSALTYDEVWLERATPSDISRETNEAIAAALRRSADETPSNPLEGTPLAGFSGVLDDPAALSRYLLGDADFSASRTEGR